MSKQTYKLVTDKIIELLEAGVVPWRQQWNAVSCGLGGHANLISQNPYRGINAMMTAGVAMQKGYTSAYWVTFKQASDLGASIRKGEKGTPIVFWKINEEERDDGKLERSAFVSHSAVFNLDQVEGLDTVKAIAARAITEPKEFTPIEAAEALVKGYIDRPRITFEGAEAYYRPSADAVTIPVKGSFKRSEALYSVLFHELVHSTGHETRLKREGIIDGYLFGSAGYSKEELVAEMGAAFLCAIAGIDSDANMQVSAAYIKNWLKVLKADPSMVLTAAGAAQKAADYIQGREPASKAKPAKKPARGRKKVKQSA